MDETLDAGQETTEFVEFSDYSPDSSAEEFAEDSSGADSAVVEATCEEYLGRWNRLISTTNWEKGRIIAHWRHSLIEAGAPVSAYCDEAWSRRVGNVTPQHVGRLRRVCEQFGETYSQYPGLYWSHFQAALDWSDAEMWLEGAVQNGWSVAQMRTHRWEATGASPQSQPRDEEIVAAETDEDVSPEQASSEESGSSVREVKDPEDKADSDSEEDSADEAPFDVSAESGEGSSTSPVRPFENLPSLPADLAEAFDLFKLAILAHRISGWGEISPSQVAAALDSLKQLALAPADASN